MDPDEARKRMIELANTYKALADKVSIGDGSGIEEALEAGDNLVDAVHDLDTWLRQGGFLPDAWSRRLDANMGRLQDVGIDNNKPLTDTNKVCVAGDCSLDYGHDGGHN